MAEATPRWPLWARVGAPLAVLVVALIIGSGVFDGSAPTQAQHVAAIERVIKCPSCPDISVAQSNESTALAVRHAIVRQVAEGRTTAQIEQSLVDQYGPTILLEPPDAGGFAVIWLVPIVLGAGTLVALGLLFWRRAQQFARWRQAMPPEAS